MQQVGVADLKVRWRGRGTVDWDWGGGSLETGQCTVRARRALLQSSYILYYYRSVQYSTCSRLQ